MGREENTAEALYGLLGYHAFSLFYYTVKSSARGLAQFSQEYAAWILDSESWYKVSNLDLGT